MSDSGYRLNFHNVTFGDENGSFTCISVLELIRDFDDGLWANIRGHGSYQDKQRNIEVRTRIFGGALRI